MIAKIQTSMDAFRALYLHHPEPKSDPTDLVQLELQCTLNIDQLHSLRALRVAAH
jgi:hypothetical protein